MQNLKSLLLLLFVLTACADGGKNSPVNAAASTDKQVQADIDTDGDGVIDEDETLPEDEVTTPDEGDTDFAHSAKLTVMTYNINGIPCMRDNFLGGILDFFGADKCPTKTWESKNIDERMKKLTDIIQDLEKKGKLPDVLLLQEAFRAKVFQVDDDAINKLIDKMPYRHIANGPEARIENTAGKILKSLWNHDGLLNSGVIILSKFPITKEDTLKFGKLCARGICNAQKGVAYAQVKVPGLPKPIDFFNTHHQSFTEEEAIRKKQNVLMFDFMKKNENSTWAIAGGDFNFKNTKAYETFDHFLKGSHMTHAGLACLEDEECEVGKDTKQKQVQGDVLDHQFFSTNDPQFDIRPSRVEYGTFKMGSHDLSDHDYHVVEYTLSW